MKLQCPCGQKIAFDPTPAMAEDSFQFACPSCGQDYSSVIRDLVSRHFQESTTVAGSGAEATAPAPKAMLLGVTEDESPPPAITAKPGLTLAGASPSLGAEVTPEAAEATSTTTSDAREPGVSCLKHPSQMVGHHCLICRKSMCPECMKAFGFVCSIYCRDAAEKAGLALPEFEGQNSSLRARSRRQWRWAAAGVVAGMILLIGLWSWYRFVGSKPRLVQSIALASQAGAGQCRIVDAKHALVWRDSTLACFSLPQLEKQWSQSFQGGSAAGSEDGFDFLHRGTSSEWYIIEDYVWLALADRLVQVRWKDGSVAREIPLPGGKRLFAPGRDYIHAVARGDLGRAVAMRIDARSGQPEAEAPADRSAPPAPQTGFPAPAATRNDFTTLVSGDASLVRMTTRLLEHRLEQVKVMKDAPKESALNGKVNAAATLDIANEIFNEMERNATGGVEERDVSRYEVRLEWMFEPEPVRWTGEVVGSPKLYNLASVDLLLAGSDVIALDRNGTKRWEGKLAYPVNEYLGYVAASPMDRDHRMAVPCLEWNDLVLVFDVGMVTAFHLDSGEARWRLPAAGTTSLLFDAAGALYVNGTDATQDQVKYTGQIDVERRNNEVIFKIDPASGKIIWQAQGLGWAGAVSGRYVYALDTGNGGSSTGWKPGSGTAMRLRCLEAKSGRPLWQHHQKQMPLSMDVHDRSILALFPNELQSLKFMDL